MIRNVKVKRLLVSTLSPIFSFVNRIVPKNQCNILIYCANGELNDNSEVLYHHLVSHDYTNKYKVIVSGDKTGRAFHAGNNVSFVSRLKGIYYYMRSKYVFYSFGKLPIKPANSQMVVNLWHGIPCKTIGKLSNINNGEEFFFTYVCASSELFRPIMAKAFGCPEKNVCICGEQKTDQMFVTKKNEKSQKLIVWAPTFRQSSVLGYDDSAMSSLLPCVEDSEWKELNHVAKNSNIRLIVKLHGKQNLYGFKEELFSNLEIYSDDSFKRRGMNLYELLGESDALLSDYSSVYLQYLIANRPIGFVLRDLKEYAKRRGFVFDDPLKFMPGEKIFDRVSLYKFIENIAAGYDTYKEEREKIRNIVHQYQDAHNCERILKISGVNL